MGSPAEEASNGHPEWLAFRGHQENCGWRMRQMKKVLYWLIGAAMLLGVLVVGSSIRDQWVIQHDNRFRAALSRGQLSEALRELLAIAKYEDYDRRSLQLARDF